MLFSPDQKRERARDLLFRPGGHLALQLSHHSVVLLVNETLFAHGGILPHHGTHSAMAEMGWGWHVAKVKRAHYLPNLNSG